MVLTSNAENVEFRGSELGILSPMSAVGPSHTVPHTAKNAKQNETYIKEGGGRGSRNA